MGHVFSKIHNLPTTGLRFFTVYGDVLNTFCDVSDLEWEFNYRPSTTLKEGLMRFAAWYKGYYVSSLPPAQ